MSDRAAISNLVTGISAGHGPIVGLAGLEPAASSLSEIDSQAPCYPASSQVVLLHMSYYEPGLVAGSKLEQPVVIPDGVHAELRRLGVRVTRFVEDFMGARLPTPEEERALQLPSGVPVTRNIRTAYAGDQSVEVMDTISHGEVVMHRFEIKL
jgi:GntR family transcriptional regulator